MLLVMQHAYLVLQTQAVLARQLTQIMSSHVPVFLQAGHARVHLALLAIVFFLTVAVVAHPLHAAVVVEKLPSVVIHHALTEVEIHVLVMEFVAGILVLRVV